MPKGNGGTRNAVRPASDDAWKQGHFIDDSFGEYRYHATTASGLRGIIREGIKKSRGMFGSGVYFAPTEQDALDWGTMTTGGKRVFRVKVKDLIARDYDDMDDTQGVADKNIPLSILEIKANGQWMSVKEYKRKYLQGK